MLNVDKRIKIVLLMVRLQSVTPVRSQLALDWCELPSERKPASGSVLDRKRDGRQSNEEEREEVVQHLWEENSNTSIRKLSNETGFSYGSVKHTMRIGLKKFPYKLQVH